MKLLPNISILRSRLSGRSTLILAERAQLGWKANVVNMQPAASAITVGHGSIIKGELLTFAHGGKISIGSECYFGEGSRIWSGHSVTIGNNVLMAHNISIMDNLTHPKDYLARREHFRAIANKGHPEEIDLDDRPVNIGDDVWIGAHSLILRGVTIGARAIVAAGSVVVKSVPPDSIVAGNPSKIISSTNQE